MEAGLWSSEKGGIEVGSDDGPGYKCEMSHRACLGSVIAGSFEGVPFHHCQPAVHATNSGTLLSGWPCSDLLAVTAKAGKGQGRMSACCASLLAIP